MNAKSLSTYFTSVLILAGLMTGCATQKIDWTTRVGSYTFDQAVVNFGPPDKQAKLSDESLVAEWLTSRGRSHSHITHGYGYPYSYRAPIIYPDYMDSGSPDYFLRLVFGPDGKLASWKKFAR